MRRIFARIRWIWRDVGPQSHLSSSQWGSQWSQSQRLRIVVILLGGMLIGVSVTDINPWAAGNALTIAISLWLIGMSVAWRPPGSTPLTARGFGGATLCLRTTTPAIRTSRPVARWASWERCSQEARVTRLGVVGAGRGLSKTR